MEISEDSPLTIELDNLLEKGCDAPTNERFTDEGSDETMNEVKEGFKLYKTHADKSLTKLQQKTRDLQEVANKMERVHWRTTVGTLTGGILGVVGGITAIAGLALAPYTLEIALISTAFGIGLTVIGGVISAASNITNMINDSIDRKKVEKTLKEYGELMEPFQKCMKDLMRRIKTLQKLSVFVEKNQSSHSNADLAMPSTYHPGIDQRGLPEVATHAARALSLAEIFTELLSALFHETHVYFTSVDGKEIHSMMQTNTDSTAETQSTITKFIVEVRKTTRELERGLDELKDVMIFFSE
ncbi:apolipoprotein L3-like isoform X1 [Scleropages formosus]|uniref:Apolipoprotein L3-like n=1 Tax=Scleropages formosus TaxID=113540 RepID=A0A8C9RVK5_SCLFO|nr:apolipoprotein L3-like isoform X1 [Scleropages formosus]XP_018619000.1 apolipoprotein L3-like isoform X1 [Scleropages formosus]